MLEISVANHRGVDAMKLKLGIITMVLLLCMTACNQNVSDVKAVENEEIIEATSGLDNKTDEVEEVEEVAEVELNIDQLESYYGKWTISSLHFTNAPSVWGKSDLEKYLGTEVILSKDQVSFDGVILEKPFYKEEILSSNDLYERFVTTYAALGIEDESSPKFVTICTDSSLSEESIWSSESMVYRFFVKDETSLMAENKNAYFVLTLVE